MSEPDPIACSCGWVAPIPGVALGLDLSRGHLLSGGIGLLAAYLLAD